MPELPLASPPPRPLLPRPALTALGVVAGAIGVLGTLRAWPDTIDDAYITFRYIDNLLAGHGLCYNRGVIVEGYSNPLFLFFLAPFKAAGLSLEWVTRIVGMMSFGFCALAATRLARAFRLENGRKEGDASDIGSGTRETAALAAIVVLCQFPLLYYSMTGLETGFYAALIAAGLWRYGAAGNRVDFAGAALWTAVALSRPEGILYPAFLGVYELARVIVERRLFGGRGDSHSAAAPVPVHPAARLRSVFWLLTVALAFGLFLVWRKSYFGRWLPNTFTAKPPGTAALAPDDAGWGMTFGYVWGFAKQMGVLVPALAFWTLREWRRPLVAAAWSVILAGLLFGFYTGGDWMPASRFLLPVFVPLSVLGVIGAVDLAGRLRGNRPASLLPHVLLWIAAASAIISPAHNLYVFYDHWRLNPYHILNAQTCKRAAIELREAYGTDKTIVAHRIGALGEFSGMTVVDLFGLVDPAIAEIVAKTPSYHPGRRCGDDVPELRAYIASKKPDLLLVVTKGPGFPPNFELYGYLFLHRRVWKLGDDERWELYERAR